MSNSSLAQDGDEGSQRDEVFEDTGLDFGSHLGSIDEEQDSWSHVETGRKEELEWYREAAEQEPDGPGADAGRPVRHPKRLLARMRRWLCTRRCARQSLRRSANLQ